MIRQRDQRGARLAPPPHETRCWAYTPAVARGSPLPLWAARSVSRVQYLERQIRGCHRRRTVKHWLNNVGIGFDYIGANPEKYSQPHYRGSDCKTHVLAHLGNLQLGGMSIREKRV